MVLHCAGRLGVLSSLYQNRHTLAASIGLISEKPITTCKSDYFQFKDFNLKLDEHHDNAPVIVALEITLFFQPITEFTHSALELKKLVPDTLHAAIFLHNFFLDIFHPPQA